MEITFVVGTHNDSYLLQHWIKHHREICNRTIIVDYHSTDNSREVFEKEAPDSWEWTDSRDYLFHAIGYDQQAMEQERRFSGWKMCLNITEFIFHPYLYEYLEQFEQEYPGVGGIATNTYMMVDRVEDRSNVVDSGKPLVIQKFYGVKPPEGWGRQRLLHKYEDGQYMPGRHRYNRQAIYKEDLILLWFNYAPFDFVKPRKLMIKHQVPQSDLDAGRSHHFMVSEGQLEEQYLDWAGRTTNLFEDPVYREAYCRYRSDTPEEYRIQWSSETTLLPQIKFVTYD